MNIRYKPIFRNVLKSQKCNYSISDSSSQNIRCLFNEYFIKHGHVHIPSSPVIPYQDPSLAFVNAGMNQFKQVFLGNEAAPYPCAVNSQKCIRVGGKHNDLKDVGLDGYHHTFFEMLGNWSFGRYFKLDACELALKLLTEVFSLPLDRLYFTYFNGDDQLSLPPDFESRNAWKSLGIPDGQILPFGSRDNFWEMGQTGPCGPCSEIHYAKPGVPNPQALVNQGTEDVLELWNLVFIQFNRDPCGSLVKLPVKHVDTGMGLERLATILQNCQNNYETDLFRPLFDKIYQLTGAEIYQGKFSVEDKTGIDTAYRRLADHSRMITVALCDGMFPDEKHSKLRYVLRKAIHVTQQELGCYENILPSLSEVVAASLGCAYPEIPRNLSRTKAILAHEYRLYNKLTEEGSRFLNTMTSQERQHLFQYSLYEIPGLIVRYRDCITNLITLSKTHSNNFDHDLKELYFKSKLPYNIFEDLVQDVFDRYTFNLKITEQDSKFDKCIAIDDELALVLNSLTSQKIPHTIDDSKYEINDEGESKNWSIPQVNSTVLAIFLGPKCVPQLKLGEKGFIVTNVTNFFGQAGGQVGDIGIITKNDNLFDVENTFKLGEYVLHYGNLTRGVIEINDEVIMKVNQKHRQGCTRNHTATHLLNAALTNNLGIVNQTSSSVQPDYLKFEFQSYQGMLTPKQVMAIEEEVNCVIKVGLPVVTKEIKFSDACQQPDITLMPYEKYPLVVRVVDVVGTEPNSGYIHKEEINFFSRELCCGTHSPNTADLKQFVITSVTAPHQKTLRSVRSIRAVTGDVAHQAITQTAHLKDLAERIKAQFKKLKKKEQVELDDLNVSYRDLQEARSLIKTTDIRAFVRIDIEAILEDCEKVCDTLLRKCAIEQFRVAQKSRQLPHYIDVLCGIHSGAGVSKIGKKILGMCNIPSMVFMHTKEGFLRGRCLFPKNLETDKFNAKSWTAHVAMAINGKALETEGNNQLSVYLIGTSYFSTIEQLQSISIKAVQVANEFATRSASLPVSLSR